MADPLNDQDLEVIGCLCGSRDTAKTIQARDESSGLVFDFQRCARCGLEYLSPRPRPNAIMRFYGDDYFPHDAAPQNPEPLRSTLFQLAVNVYYPTGQQPIAMTLARPFLKFLLFPFRHRSILAFRPPSSKRLFEFGLGSGADARRFRHAGWDVAGCEPSPRAWANLREQFGDIQNCAAEDAVLADRTYSAMLMNNVFEHVHDPKGILAKCHRALTDDGVVILIVPNHRSFPGAMFEGISLIYDAPRHLWGFSPGPLKTLLEEAGFTIDYIEHRAPLPWFWRIGLRRWMHHHRWPAWIMKFALLPLTFIFLLSGFIAAAFGKGAFIKVVARKNRS